MIEKGREKLVNPGRAIVGERCAVLAFPKGDHRSQPRLLVANQQQAACESRNLSECTLDGCRNGRSQPVHLLRLGYKLHAQRRHTARRGGNAPAHRFTSGPNQKIAVGALTLSRRQCGVRPPLCSTQSTKRAHVLGLPGHWVSYCRLVKRTRVPLQGFFASSFHCSQKLSTLYSRA